MREYSKGPPTRRSEKEDTLYKAVNNNAQARLGNSTQSRLFAFMSAVGVTHIRRSEYGGILLKGGQYRLASLGNCTHNLE